MKTAGRFISLVLILNFVLYPQDGFTQTVGRPLVNFSLVKQLAYELKHNPGDYFSKEELSLKESMLEKSVTNEAVDKIKKKLKDESYSFSEIKQEILSQQMVEEQNRLIEMKVILSKVSSEKLDMFFETAMKDGKYSSDFFPMYESAYNQLEKIDILMQMIHSDLGQIRSQNAKQLGLFTRDDLLKQIEVTGTLFSNKNDKVITVLIVVLTVAVAGLATWGIISATKARHERKKKELNNDFDGREQQAHNNHAQAIKDLEAIFKERERLREEGYVWQVCSTTKTFKSAYCQYDYLTHSGEETCVTRCLKQPQTGAEAMHSKTCLSDFIPNNCFQKNPTAAGYDDGYSSGYNRGYDVGYDRGYFEAYRSAYNNAYSSAYYKGYDSGYSSGFSAGYSDGSSKKVTRPVLSLLKGDNDEFAMGFNKGFFEGHSYALTLRTGANY